MKRRKLLFALTFSATLAITTLTGCGNQETATDDGNGEPASQTLVMATSPDYPPYEFYETASGEGEPIGFDIDIAKYITEQLGYELEISGMDFNGIIPALQSERADFAMAGMTPTEERKENVDFSNIYYEAKNTIVTKKDAGYDSFEALQGKEVGVQLGATQQETAEQAAEEVGGFEIEPRNKISELIQEVKAGRIDAAIVEDTVAKGYVQNNPDLEFTTIENAEAAGSAIAFPQGSELTPEFNRVLEEMKANGEMDRLIQKWFEEYYEQQAQQ